MWKVRVIACIEKALEELHKEAGKVPDLDATMGTQLNTMVSKSSLEHHIKRLTEVLAEIKSNSSSSLLRK